MVVVVMGVAGLDRARVMRLESGLWLCRGRSDEQTHRRDPKDISIGDSSASETPEPRGIVIPCAAI